MSANDPDGGTESSIVSGTAIRTEISGPIPPPDVLADYERLLPGSANRIIRMAEAEQAHRHALQSKAIDARIIDANAARKEARMGQFLGLAIGLVGLAAAVIIACLVRGSGGATVASIVGGSTVIGLVTIFILGRRLPQESPGADHIH